MFDWIVDFLAGAIVDSFDPVFVFVSQTRRKPIVWSSKGVSSTLVDFYSPQGGEGMQPS